MKFESDKCLFFSIINELENQNINYCVTHKSKDFPEQIISDVDVIFSREDFLKLPHILEKFGLSQCFQHESTACCYILSEDLKNEECNCITFDASSDFRMDGLLLLTANNFLKNRYLEGGVWLPPYDIEFIYLLLKRICKTNLTPYHIERLSYLYNKNQEACTCHLYKYFPTPTIKEITKAINLGDWTSINIRKIKRQMEWYVILKKPFKYFSYLVSEVDRLFLRSLNHTGLFIQFIGIDGAGKTTVIRQIQSEIMYFFRDCEIHHFRPGILWKGRTDSQKIQDPHGEMPRNQIQSILKCIALFCDWLIGIYIYIYPAIIKSKLVMYDRGFIDIIADPYRYRLNCPKIIRIFLGNLLPKPDLIFWLDVKPETSYKRKKELSIEELRAVQANYRKIAEEYDCITVDANRSLEDVCDEVEHIILSYLQNRISKRI